MAMEHPGDVERREVLLDEWVRTRREIARLEARAAGLAAERMRLLDEDVAEEPLHRDAIYRSMVAEYSAAGRVAKGSIEHWFHEAVIIVEELPAVREAFEDGRISAAHAREIARAAEPVREAIRAGQADAAILDLYQAAALVVAENDTPMRTRAHVTQVAGALAPQTVRERHKKAHAERRVTVKSVGDGLALLSAVLPEYLAVAIHDRLTQMARATDRTVDVDAILNALFRDENVPEFDVEPEPVIEPEPAVDPESAVGAESTVDPESAVGAESTEGAEAGRDAGDAADVSALADADDASAAADAGDVSAAADAATGGAIFGDEDTFTTDPFTGEDPFADGGRFVQDRPDWVDGPSNEELAHRDAAEILARMRAEAGDHPDVIHIPEDDRTLDQIRADLLTDLLLASDPSEVHGAGLENITARIQVTVAASTLADADEKLAELDGHGPLRPDIARAIAGRHTGWTRLFLDCTGMVTSADTYTPPEPMRRFLRARDQHCRFPGCRMPVHRCQLDHNRDYALGGRTAIDNLCNLCLTHHVLKHPDIPDAHRWTARQTADGSIEWTSPLGRKYTDHPPRRVMFVPTPEPGGDQPPGAWSQGEHEEELAPF